MRKEACFKKEKIGANPDITLYLGDCIEVMKTIPGRSIDCVLTSPPYNKHSAKRKCGDKDSWKKANINYGTHRDNMPEKEYQEWQKTIIRELLRTLKQDGSIFYNHKPRIVNHKTIFPHEWLGEFIVRQMIIWNRLNSPVLEPIRFMPIVEYVFWITKERKTPKFNKEAFHYKEVWEIPPVVDKDHPATFPVKLAKRCINAATDKGDVVFDPFCGSGTTLIATKEMDRNAIGIEIEQRYYETAKKRIQNTQKSMF